MQNINLTAIIQSIQKILSSLQHCALGILVATKYIYIYIYIYIYDLKEKNHLMYQEKVN